MPFYLLPVGRHDGAIPFYLLLFGLVNKRPETILDFDWR